MQRLLAITAGLALMTLGVVMAWVAAGSGPPPQPEQVPAGDGSTSWSTDALHGTVESPEHGSAPLPVEGDSTNFAAKDGSPQSIPSPPRQVGPSSWERAPAKEPPGTPASSAAASSRVILGTWQDHYKGRRTMTLRGDGTATMVCELEGMNARLFTPVLTFDLQWQLEDGVLKKRIVGGKPEDKVQFVINLMGALAEERVLTATGEDLHLLDSDGKTEYHWKRIR